MNLEFYKEKLETSEVYKNFLIKNPEAYLASAFFTITLTDKTETAEVQLDYYNKTKFSVFSLNSGITLKEEESAIPTAPEKLTHSNLDINEIPMICKSVLEKNNITEKITRILAILTNNKENIWGISIITASMSVIKVKLNDSGELINFEKLNLFDFVKKS